MPFTKVYPDKNQIYIEIDKLVPFDNCPLEWFSKGQRFHDMLDEVHEFGIRQPIYVRPIPNGKYEILNGHYRVAAAKEIITHAESSRKLSPSNLDFSFVPALVLEGLTDEEALSYVSDTNPIGLLLKYGIDINNFEYKESEGYKSIENSRISSDDGYLMSLDEYIECFLLDDFDIISFHESIYNLGNPSELKENDCEYTALANEIVQMSDPEMISNTKQKIKQWKKSNNRVLIDKAILEEAREADRINAEIDKTVRRLRDYTRQLKNYLNIDLDSFDYNDIQNKQERAKILYFVFMLKKDYSHIDILKLLSKPSMENIDNSFLGWETSNGKYIKAIKHSIEKEISLNLKNNIKGTVSHIVNKLGAYMQDICSEVELLADFGQDISNYVSQLQSINNDPFLPERNSEQLFLPPTPLETLYLRLIQYEYLGQMKDLLTVYALQEDTDYYVPPEYINEMIEFHNKYIKQDEYDKYFEAENVRKISKYVYLKSETDKEERRRIRECKEKVLKLLSFRLLAYPEADIMDDLTELEIISCLQSILLDRKKEIFNYTFHRFEGEKEKRKGLIYVNAPFKNNELVYDALQVYWIHRFKNHLYANKGKYDLRRNLMEVETLCIKILVKILSCSTIEEMLDMNNFYFHRLTKLNYPNNS